jgi:hypothetical protein
MNLKEFVDPPRQYRPAPFWSWNDTVEPSEIESRIRDMKKRGFGGFFMHSRQGLRTKYLGDDWMRAIRRGVETARELEMEAWLYDEDRWPSGFAGGMTTSGNDAHLARALTWAPDASALDPERLAGAVAFTRKNQDGSTALLPERPESLEGIGVFYERRSTRGHARYNGEGYADLLNPDTVHEFIENTYERYSKLFRYDFGRFMPGVFTDEPNVNRTVKLRPTDDQEPFSFPWTPGFAEYFEHIHGYSPLGSLHHLLDCSDEGFKFRHDYWRTVNERFLESFTVPIAEWCKEHELQFTGHYLFEDDFRRMIFSGGSVMSHYEYLDIPGIDHLGKNLSNPWTIKQAASAANQLGKKRVVSELYGGAGQSLTFTEMKRVADYDFALGVTFLCPHLTAYSLKGDAKRDFPPTLSSHQPWWEHARALNDYLARVSWAVSRGRSAASVLVLHPISSAYGTLDIGADDGGAALAGIERSFRGLVEELLAEHVDFDLGDERILIAHAKAPRGRIRVGESTYRAVVLPAAYTWLASTVDLLEHLTCPVIIAGSIPERVSGSPSERLRQLAEKPNVHVISDSPAEIVKKVAESVGRPVTVTLADGSTARSVLVNHRVEAAAHLIFLANTDSAAPADVTVGMDALGGVVELDPLTGRAFRYSSELTYGGTVITTALPPSGSRIFLVDQTQTSIEPHAVAVPTEEALLIEGPYSFRRLHENLLVIDRCTLEIDGETVVKNGPVWKAKQALWKATGIDEYTGWQPWAMESRNVRTRTNRAALTYTFTVHDIPEKLELAMESGERFHVEVNGKEVEISAGKWHIDRGFPVFTLTDHIVAGENVIRATADFLWDTEIEPLYLAGDFAVGPEEEGFPIIREPETLAAGSWTTQGYPFYTGSMVYRLGFDLPKVSSARWEMDISGARGTTFFLTVNSVEVGSVPFPPFRGEITSALKKGANTVEVEVAGSLRNALGPLHNTADDALEMVGPAAFSDEAHWTDSYRLVPYGFIESPKLVKIR